MDLRRQPRFPFTSRITIGWQNGSANYLIHARCLDISRTGLRIESPDRIPTGERVGIEIQSAHLHTSATVRYCRHSGLTFIIGLEFGFGANATIDKIIPIPHHRPRFLKPPALQSPLMANLTLPSPSRRSFLTSFLGAATVLRSAAPSMHWALLSDTHIAADPSNTYRGFKPFDNLKKIVPEIVAARPQGALICGDVARLIGEAADYRQVQSLLQPLAESTPIAMALGNHDDRKNFSSVLGATQQGAIALKDRHLLAIESPIARFLILDSLVTPNSTPGFLGKAQRSWLDDFLRSSSNLPTLLFVHHTLDDNDGALLDAPRLLDIAKRHPKVKAIIYGHSHRYYYETWENIHLINLPAVGYNFNDNEPVGWVDTTLSPTGAHFTLKAFGGNTAKNGQTTELKWLR